MPVMKQSLPARSTHNDESRIPQSSLTKGISLAFRKQSSSYANVHPVCLVSEFHPIQAALWKRCGKSSVLVNLQVTAESLPRKQGKNPKKTKKGASALRESQPVKAQSASGPGRGSDSPESS